MKKHLIILIILSTSLVAQGQVIVSIVPLQEKQNQMIAALPKILMDAMSRGDIKAYYPKNLRQPVSYPQFLNHFGDPNRAYQALVNTAPSWFCQRPAPISMDASATKCFSYHFEIIEELETNRQTFQQVRKLKYIRLVYSARCNARGVQMEGPIFKIEDIGRLKDRRYSITNPRNAAVRYSIMDVFNLHLYHAIK